MKLFNAQEKISISIDKRWIRPSAFVFVGLAGVVLSVMVVGDRSQLLDQDNYINYFRLTDIGWFMNIWTDRSSFLSFAISMMTEELGWRAWVLAINALGVIAILFPETKAKQPLGLLLLSAVVMMVMYDAIKNYFAGVYVPFL